MQAQLACHCVCNAISCIPWAHQWSSRSAIGYLVALSRRSCSASTVCFYQSAVPRRVLFTYSKCAPSHGILKCSRRSHRDVFRNQWERHDFRIKSIFHQQCSDDSSVSNDGLVIMHVNIWNNGLKSYSMVHIILYEKLYLN